MFVNVLKISQDTRIKHLVVILIINFSHPLNDDIILKFGLERVVFM